MEWNRRNIIGAIVILVLGFGAGGVIYVSEEGGWKFAMFRLEKWAEGLYGGESEMTADEMRLAKRKTERIRKDILAKIPGLQLNGNHVPRELNGFLAMYEFAEDSNLKSLIDSRILDRLHEEKIEVSLIREDLALFEAVGNEIERIAALPESSNIIDGKIHSELLRGGETKGMGDYLCLKAILAAMDGDEAESFRYLSLAANLTEHIGSVEVPYFLSETIYILMRQNLRSVFFQWILPNLDESADLVKWQSILEPRTQTPQRHRLLLIGEWNMLGVGYMHMIFDMAPDPEETMMAWARYTEANAKRHDAMNFQQFSVAKILPYEPFTKNLSREGVGLFDILLVGGGAWTRGAIRSVVVEHHYAAALDLLIREQKGEDISKRTETFLLDPHTGKPFAFDGRTRTLVEVTGTYDVPELKLPW